jgi:MFS family permease
VAISTSFFIDRVSLRKVIFIMMLVTGILTALVGLVPVRVLWITLFFQSACVASFYPVVFLSIGRMFPGEAHSMATGFVLVLSIALGAGGIPYLLGFSGD